MKTKEEILFEEAPVGRAVLSLVIPTVISQLITVIYNMADTFFIGQIGDPNQVAAVSLCMPMFVFLTGLANLFGIGGSSLMSRSLGTNDHQKAKRTAAFSIWTAIVASLVYGLGRAPSFFPWLAQMRKHTSSAASISFGRLRLVRFPRY